MLKLLGKLLGGNKSEKDVAQVKPLVEKANQYFNEYQQLDNDALRNKTQEFKQRIKNHLQNIDAEIDAKKAEAEALPITEIHSRDAIYREVDALKKKRDQQIEEALNAIQAEAFAVVKETARRFTTNAEVVSTATELDRNLSVKKDYVRIEGNQSIYKNTWTAAGGQITWNMVHYDVQLIGGSVLHSGKIAEMSTGEGKTLVSTLPAYLNALAGEGVHIVTVNDYLARRDGEWNGTIFEWLGLTVDCIDGAFYKTYKAVSSFAGKHVWKFTDINNKTYQETFEFIPFSLAKPIPAAIAAKDVELSFSGLPEGAMVNISIADTSGSTNDIDKAFTIAGGKSSRNRVKFHPQKQK